MQKLSKRTKLLWLTISSLSASFSSSSFSQTEAEIVGSKGKPEKTSDTIQVTGSRLKRSEMETSAPITIIDSNQIENSGLSSLGEIFRNSATLSPIGNFSGSSQYVASGSSSLNLLGLGSSRTLVLLNGKRLPVSSGLNAVNVDNIPLATIDRIEVLSGGASAIYGADAVGGVINIITKTQLDGTNVSLFLSIPSQKGGEAGELSISQGVKLDDATSIIVSGGYRRRQPVDKRNRDLAYGSEQRQYTASNPPAGTYSYRPVFSSTNDDGGVSQTVGNWTPSSNCPTANQIATVPSQPNNVYCAGLRKDRHSELIPYKDEYYVNLNAAMDLNANWTASALIGYSRSFNKVLAGNYLSSADPYSNSPTLLTKEKALELGVIGSDQELDYVQIMSPVAEMPEREYRNINETGIGAVYLEGLLNSGWDIQGGISYATNASSRIGVNMQNSQTYHDIVVNSEHPEGADPKFIVIDPNRDSSLLTGTLTNLKSKSEADTLTVDAFASRSLFDLPGGAFSLGFGASYMHESFKLISDSRDEAFNEINEPLYTGTFAPKGEGNRTVKSAYTEILAPVAKWAELSSALRFDQYSDFDDVVNYGLGLKVAAFDFLTLRTRAASSYKAPPLSYLHQNGGGGYFSIRDENWCNRENEQGRVCELSNPRRYVYVENPGNKELKPEVGLNYTAGFILEPFTGFTLIADHYWINLEKTFQRDELQEVADKWYGDNGTTSQGGQLGDNVIKLDTDGIITSIELPYRNLGQLKMRGIDAKMKYQVSVDSFRFDISSDYFRLLSYKEKDTDEKPLREIVGYFGLPPWRLNNAIQISKDKQFVSIRSRTIAAQIQDPENATPDNENSRVDDYTAYDIVYGFDLTSQFRFQVGVNNLFNKLGGVVDGNSLKSEDIVSSSLYSYNARVYFARFTADL